MRDGCLLEAGGAAAVDAEAPNANAVLPPARARDGDSKPDAAEDDRGEINVAALTGRIPLPRGCDGDAAG